MILRLIVSLTMILIIQFVVKQTLSAKVDKRVAIVTFSTFVLSILLTYTFYEQWIINVIGIFFALFAPLITLKGVKKRQILFISIFTLGLISIVATLVGGFFSIIPGRMQDSIWIDFFVNSAFLLLCLPAHKRGVFEGPLYKLVQLRLRMKLLVVISIWVSTFLVASLSFFIDFYVERPGVVFMGILIAAMIVLIGIMSPALIMKYLSSAHYENLSNIMNKQLQAQVAHYETTSKMTEDIRKFRHDFANLRVGIIDLLARGDTKGALALLNADEVAINESKRSFSTGNLVLDALLMEKLTKAELINASIELDGTVPGELLSAADTCVIFGNALDNAVESCAKCHELSLKVIRIKSKFADGFLFIKIENPTVSDVKIIGNTVPTTKKDRHSHGIGLQSMQKAAEKYSGTMTLTCEDKIFCVEIALDFNFCAKETKKRL